MKFLSFFLSAILCLSFQLALNGQTITLDDGDTEEFVKHYEVGAAFTININLDVSTYPGGVPDWEFCEDFCTAGSSCSCGTLDPVTTFGSNIGGETDISVVYNTTPNGQISSTGLSAGEYVHRVRVSDSGDTWEAELTIRLIIRRPLDLFFVLDRSGSMRCNEDGSDCSPGLADSRFALLRDGVSSFLGKTDDPENQLLASDRIGVTFFASTASPGVNTTNLNTAANYNAHVASINASLSGSPSGATTIGGGIAQTMETLNSPSGNDDDDRRQVLLIFTDGEQNREPMVTISGNNIGGISGTNSPLPGAINFANANFSNYERYPVATITTPSAVSIFETIQNNAGDFLQVEDDIIDAMSTVHTEIYSSSTPNFIGFEEQEGRDENRATFTCNKDVSRLIFEVHFNKRLGREYEYLLLKDGKAVTPTDINRGVYFTDLIVNFSKTDEVQSSEGEWTLVCKRTTPPGKDEEVRLAAIADDHFIDFRPSIDQDRLKTCDKMDIRLAFSHNGKPIKGAEVKAIVLKPGDDLGDILGRTTFPAVLPQGPDSNSTCATQRLHYLATQAPESLEALKTLDQRELKLRYHHKSKTYSCPYRKTDVSGVYKIIFLAKAEVPGIGTVVRAAERTVNVNFGDVKHRQGQPQLVQQTPSAATLTYLPSFKAGGVTRLVGPGFGSFFKVNGQGAQLANVVDNCNGGYTLNLQLDGDPNININLFGDNIYTGPVSKFERRAAIPGLFQQFTGNIYAGVTLPSGILDDLYDPGFFVAGGINTSLFTPDNNTIRKVSLEVMPGYYSFQDNFNIIGANLYLNGDINFQDNYRLRVGAGVGLYKPKDLDATGGYSFKGSISTTFRRNSDKSPLVLSLDGTYHVLNQPDYTFSTIGASFIFPF